jgi:uncharacterized RDD family membrane protein YckC
MNAYAQPSAASLSGSKLDNRRMLAALIDLAVVGVGTAVIMVAAGVAGGDGATVGAPLAGVAVCWALYYYFACESGGGQTLGKKVTGVRVVRLDGSAAGMREIAVRTALRVVDTTLVGLIAMLATGERRARLGDLAAGTMIVSTDATETRAPEAPAPRMGAITLPEAPLPPSAEPPPAAAAAAPSVPELRPFEPFVEPDEAEAAESDDEPVVELSVVEEAPVELSVVEAPVEEEPVSADPAAGGEGNVLDLTTPSLKELAEDVAAASDWRRPAIEPVEDPEPEPLVAVEPEPVIEAEPEPLVEVAAEPEPLAVVEPEPELAAEVEPEPLAAVEPEPVLDAEPVIEPEPVGAVEPEPVVDVEPVDEAGPGEVSVRSVETVSAIDLIMGEQEPEQGPPAGDDPPGAA